MTMSRTKPKALVAGLLAITVLAACAPKKPQMPTPGPVQVKAITVAPSSTETYADKVGEVRGSREVDLRALISGILLKQHFTDGALVREGELLFSIDAREYNAQVASAQARLASAQANLARANQDVGRYRPLLADEAISQQVYDNAVTVARQAEAEVAANRAAVAQAQLGVEYASVRAPLSGRIGAAKVYAGDLVTAGQTSLATLSSDDPAWVRFSISEAELLELEKRTGGRKIADDDPIRTVQLILGDGSVYPLPGRVNFGDRALNSTTGTYSLRAEFPNPNHQLMPGLFARIRASGARIDAALVVPDRAVQEQLGRYFVTSIDKEGKAEMRPVELGQRFGNRWVVRSGLTAGDRVVVEGIQKAKPGTPVQVTEVKIEDFDRPAAATNPSATAAAN